MRVKSVGMEGIGGHGKGTFRLRMHELMRKSILEAAHQRAAAGPWSSVRVSDIADEVGVSRQTVYNEFGTKEDLAHALLQEEISHFIAGIVARMKGAPDLPTALTEVLRWLFDAATNHAIISRMIVDAKSGESDSLLPLLTVRADGVLLPARALLLDSFTQRWPTSDLVTTEQVIDLFIRLAISEVVMPSDQPREDIIRHMVAMTDGLMAPRERPRVAGSTAAVEHAVRE